MIVGVLGGPLSTKGDEPAIPRARQRRRQWQAGVTPGPQVAVATPGVCR